MNPKQVFVTFLIIIILLYVGLYGIIQNILNDNNLDHYVVFVLNIIPSVSILLGLLVRVLLGRSETVTKFLVSTITCSISCVLLIIIYTFLYDNVDMLNDIPGFLLYCLIVNIFLLLSNFIITAMGFNNNKY
ncbi:MAG: hypothetical protein ABF289_01950 [Clostridiales bacterium]